MHLASLNSKLNSLYLKQMEVYFSNIIRILEMGACWPGSAAGDTNKDWALHSFLLIILSMWVYLSPHGGNMAASAPSRK